jgi:glycosyltransferase involved in cell wall biosynthesis
MANKIDALVTCFNKEGQIKSVLEALVAVADLNKIIVIDDHSSDCSVNHINEVAAECDRIKVYQNSINRGVSYCRNFLISKSDAKFLMFVDGDDIVVPSHKLLQLQSFLAGEFLLSYSDFFRSNRVIRAGSFSKNRLRYTNFIPFSSTIVSSNFLRSNNLRFLDIHHEDYKFWLDVSDKLDANQVHYFNKPTYVFSRVGAGLSSNVFRNALSMWRIIRSANSQWRSAFLFVKYAAIALGKRS